MAYKKGFESAFISSLDRIEMLNERQVVLLDSMATSLSRVADKLDKLTDVLVGKGSKKDVEFLITMGGGISSIASGLIAFSKVPDGVPEKLNNFIQSFLKIMDDNAEAIDKMSQGVQALDMIGGAILKFAYGIVLAAPGLLISILIAPLAAVAIGLYGLMFYTLGLAAGPIEKGSDALASMGKGLLFFSAGALALGLVAMLMTPETILKSALLIGAIGGTVALLGLVEKFVNRGAFALAVAGLGLTVFSVGIGAFALVAHFVTYEDVEKMGLILLGTATVLTIAGLAAPFIMMGGAALGVAGIGLLLLSGGIFTLAKVVQGSQGLFEPSTLDPEKTNLEVVVGGIISAFAVNPLKAAAVMIAAPAVLLAGTSMILLSAGLILMGKVFANEGVQNLFKESGNSDYPTNIELVIGSVVNALAISPITALKMIASTPAFITAGISLITVAASLKAFQKMTNSVNLDELIGSEGSPGTIEQVLTAVMGTFAKVANDNGITSAGGVKDFLFGGSNPVSAGINAVKGVGDVLVDVAEGVQAWANLTYTDKDGKKKMIDKSVMDVVSSNIQMVLGALGKEFAEIGLANGETGWFSRGTIEKGVDAIKGVGTELVDIATAVQSFANLTFMDPNDPSKKISLPAEALAPGGSVRSNIKNAIISITEALAMAGADEGAQRGFFGWGSSDIDRGKAAIAGVGKDLQGIAEIVRAASEINLAGVAGKVANILTLVPRELIKASEFFTKNQEAVNKGARIPRLLSNMLIQPMLELIDEIDEMTAVVENFEKIGDIVKGMKDDINEMDLEKVNALGDIFEYSSKLDANLAALQALQALVTQATTPAPAAASATATTGTTATGTTPAAGTDLASLTQAIQQLPNQLKTAVSTAKIVLYSNENLKIAES